MDRPSPLRAVGFPLLVLLASQSLPAQEEWTSPRRTERPAALPASQRPEVVALEALRANPVTAPYTIATAWQKGAVVLSGKVGTGAIHDAAVRTIIDLGYPVRDDLVIDTAEAHRVAMNQPPQAPRAGPAPYFVYPPPLFGYLDDPFFGMEPPLVSYPPWAAAARVMDPMTRPANVGNGSINGQSQGQGQGSAAMIDRREQPVEEPPRGDVRLTVDASGQVFLSGTVASEEDRRTIEQEARNTPGVTQVHSDLKVVGQQQAQPQASEPAMDRSNVPPPPPQPMLKLDQNKAPRPLPAPIPPNSPASEQNNEKSPQPAVEAKKPAAVVVARDTHTLTERVKNALDRRPSLAGMPIGVESRGDTVTISGKVASAYEAMLAHRAVEQTPGVREIIDELEFQLPDENHPNPLIKKSRPEDLEPYLTSQIRRHVGELAYIAPVRIRGNHIEVHGTLLDEQSKPRVEAVLRSMPLLREFQIDHSFQIDR